MTKHTVNAAVTAILAATAVLTLPNLATAQSPTPERQQHTRPAVPTPEDDEDFNFDDILDEIIGDIGDIGG